jgi:hypothetical protein
LCDSGVFIGFQSDNIRDQRLATIDEPHRPILSRVRCIALFNVVALRTSDSGVLFIFDRPNRKRPFLAALPNNDLVGFSLNLNFSVAALKDVLALLCKLSFFEIAENISQINQRLAVLAAFDRPNHELSIIRRGCDCCSGSDRGLDFLGS